MTTAFGKMCWAIPEGYLPEDREHKERAYVSHEAACLFNAGDVDAHVQLHVYFADREPVGPYEVTVPARRTLHLRFNDLREPEPIPRGTDYSTLITSDVPIVVQYTRLDSRRSDIALLSTLAFACD
ncbi:MAG TPA: sensory rhodopsin transducer [Polyangiaceae bacterium]|nr:sensory rhodopsin transducer [Polyangiaceae bacterium]